MLESGGHAAYVAANGQIGLKEAHDKLPDLILLDLALPDFNGFFVLQVLNAHHKTRRIPVLIITGHADPGALLKTAAAGQHACGFLRKPFTADELLCRVAAILKRKVQDGVPAPSAEELGSPAGKLRFLRKGVLIADLFGRQLWVNGRAVSAPTERRFDLLCALMRSDGPINRQELLLQVWDDVHDIGIVGITVMRLRKDLYACPEIRITSSRDGYKLVAQPC